MEYNYFTILWWVLEYNDVSQSLVYMCPPTPAILKPPPTSRPTHPSLGVLSQSTCFGCPASCMELALVICSTYGNTHASMLFSHIIPPLPSPTMSESLFLHVCLLLPCI